ncbi:transcription-repair coupling factor [Neptuniibacter caesariensis]|uniref:Transcription-repair-coupling factor n=1 Tax=Neptuniibacter caesariensis TaxID=207954 RepID=A0A7U8C5Q6_NEPCE|nr:transcription-repair coupling factor [Neptuniibacter caesariensis]EAR60590.1 transcription-repair coupling protein Mfd [Oceanospirillum sp. MED92] [Neptuniibacter caesariensis]
MLQLDYPLPSGPGDRKTIGQVHGAATGLLISDATKRFDGFTLVITKDTLEANRLLDEVNFFSADEKIGEILSFPDWEILPYDTFSPHQDIISERISTLNRLPSLKNGILIAPLSTLMHRTAPADFIAGNCFDIKIGDTINPDALRKQLTDAGYHAVETVLEHGEYAIRGSIIDLFPTGSEHPFRIELFDNEIETLRTFDPESQRSIEKIEAINLLPAKEFPFDSRAISNFKARWRERFDVDYRQCPIYTNISDGLTSPGIEYYLPLFFDDSSSIFASLPEKSQIIVDSTLEDAVALFTKEVEERYEQRRYDITNPVLTPQELFLTTDQLFAELKKHGRLTYTAESIEEKSGRTNIDCNEAPNLPVDSQHKEPLTALQNFLMNRDGPILFCAESAGRREALLELLGRINIKPSLVNGWNAFIKGDEDLAITEYPLEQGLSFPGQYHVITETQLFGHQVFQRRRRSKDQEQNDQVIRNLSELNTGSPVVHLDHGVGRYLGLQTIELDNQQNEFLTLEYAEGAKLYVPVSSLHLISRYTGAGDEHAPLHRLGTEQWTKAKRKAAEKARDAAAELLDIYARRAAREGFQFSSPDEQYLQFASTFPFEETPDQAAAIGNVIRDMTAKQPMDRLVCGDVGFGKTEVAMRAAFVAAQSGKQVVILVPTTLLAQQHYQNFLDRFADWPVNIELISRFRTGKQQTAILEKLQSGSVDIVVGTHKLLSGDIKFNNLGLVIIDEEHRFGVQQKERLKSLRSEVDILTLTATPIPRTLNMAMSGIRDLSIIATPPAKRLSVKTFVRHSDTTLVKEAILRELLRGGQVYYLHNEVKSIEKTAEELSELVPEARIGIGHGQMRERELEQVMSDFYHKRYNILLCTTIIETGIDVPNANTIIIDRADKFGLAQLHQLRGRVGRSHHQAYAYLLTPHKKSMTKDAIKRLEAIESADDLGAGFTLATHDLEIRGAGELLGEEQSGQMQTVGFSLFMEMLEQAVESIKEGKTPNLDQPLRHGAEINLNISALIPEDYLPDVHSRLIMYKRIANAASDKELKELQVEMIDRFGLLTDQVKNLFRLTSLKLRSESMNIFKIDAGDKSGKIEFSSEAKVDPLTLVKMVQNQPQRYKLDGADKLRFTLDMEKTEQRFKAIEGLLSDLAVKTS